MGSTKIMKFTIIYTIICLALAESRTAPAVYRPPYGGTFFYFPEVVQSNAPQRFRSARYKGYLQRTWFDRRDQSFHSGYTHIWSISTTDAPDFEVAVNPRDWPDGNRVNTVGYNLMIKHAQVITRLPAVFRNWLKTVALNG